MTSHHHHQQQQQQMMSGLFSPQNNLGQNLGSMGQSLFGGTPAYGGGNILSGDAYGGSAAAPLRASPNPVPIEGYYHD